MSLTVKAYLLKEAEPDEIRRFAVDPDVSTNHAYLRQKVTHIFPDLKDKPFSLYWKDVENELISFSSDEEQTEALGFVNDGVFKIYIKVEVGDGPEPEEENGVFHPHVFCDGCEGPVYGIRYKCTVCPDYDLCSKCKAKNLHSEHAMMAIPRPCCSGWMGFGCFPPPPPHHGHHGGPYRGHHGGPHHGHHGGPPPFPGAHPFGPCGRGPFGPWGRGRCFRAGPRMFQEMMKDVFQTSNQTKDKEEKSDCGTQNEGKGTDTHCNEERSPHEEYLKTVGEHVAAMLDPLGINVEVDVEHGGIKQRCCGQGPHHCWESSVHCEMCSDSASSRNDPEEVNPDNGDAAEVNQVDDTCMAGEEAGANTAAEQDTETGEKGSASKADNQEGSPERDWTIIDDGTKEADKAKSSSCEVSDIEMETNKDDPAGDTEKLNRALDHMKAMGFTDEGGWLTALLRATNGDINKALDAIRANRAK